ncbi:MAG TPA: prephenate dehydratase [Acidimicrobiales bacterium]|jgi:prephenate dehydratase|nr:prephenate dehydratase [Acidimicrobiales bacterium]
MTGPASRIPPSPTLSSVAFLGPLGTFTEEALLTQEDYAAAALEPMDTIGDVLEAVRADRVDVGFVPIENAIDGVVRDTLDALIFDVDLLIQREVVLDVRLHLMAPRGASLRDIRRVVSYPVAMAQCRRFFREQLPDVEALAANSTADAAKQLGAHPDRHTAAIAPRLAADLYGLVILSEDVEDYDDNQTRFVAVATDGIPQPTGHDRTTIVCFQDADRPGNLHGILGQFAARSINLTRLESRPTKQGLGEYCFAIDLSGHIADEVIADCLRDLRANLADVKFLGSYPAGGRHAPERRRVADDAWRSADEWLAGLRAQIRS